MNKNVLILGGGVAGCSLSYFLNNKGYKTTLIEKQGNNVGGLARTYYYAEHPYEFGPHVWFWPDPSPANDVIRKLTNNELYHVGRRLFSFIAEDNQAYRYPVHYEDIQKMPNKKEIEKFLHIHRDENHKLKEDELPVIGQCTFAEYFCATIGKPLFDKFMRNYAWKMWDIDPEELQTSMVWADRVMHSVDGSKKGTPGYDPIKFTDHTLGQDIGFQVYPKKGWNVVWDAMVKNTKVIKGDILGGISNNTIKVKTTSNVPLEYKMSDYDFVINTLGIDYLLDPNGPKLPYAGRMMTTVLIPSKGDDAPLFLQNAESIHYSGAEFHTRATDIDLITHHKSDNGRLMLIEIPISTPMDESCFPLNTIKNAKDNNLFVKNCYAQQSTEARLQYTKIFEDSKKKYPTLYHCGRHAEFRYLGMPETVESAYNMVEKEF